MIHEKEQSDHVNMADAFDKMDLNSQNNDQQLLAQKDKGSDEPRAISDKGQDIQIK